MFVLIYNLQYLLLKLWLCETIYTPTECHVVESKPKMKAAAVSAYFILEAG